LLTQLRLCHLLKFSLETHECYMIGLCSCVSKWNRAAQRSNCLDHYIERMHKLLACEPQRKIHIVSV
jgi:hypothetical protein